MKLNIAEHVFERSIWKVKSKEYIFILELHKFSTVVNLNGLNFQFLKWGCVIWKS